MSQPLEPGDIVYFWRGSKCNSMTAPSKKRLSLRRWHGPALLVALEGVDKVLKRTSEVGVQHGKD